MREVPAASRIDKLTRRQKDCLRLVGHGYTSKEIGPRLGISYSTVDNHLLAAIQILEAPGRAEAARMLADHEETSRQQMPRHPEDLVLSPGTPDDRGQGASPPETFLGGLLPPIGGRLNVLPTSQRVLAIAKIALFSTLVFVTCVIVIRTCFDALR
jgi:DNA-binding CsgD family transcriptional regulator